MDVTEFIIQVRYMRELQKAFFRDWDKMTLRDAKIAEAKVDKALQLYFEHLEGKPDTAVDEPTLF